MRQLHVCVTLLSVRFVNIERCSGSFFTFFTKAKISNLYISLRIQEQVVQLQISAKLKQTRL